MSTFNFKKKFGQNFLVDKNIVNKIVNDITIKENNLVIEIGPGDGKMTTKLCEKFDQVLAYEIDTDLEKYLNNNLNNYSNYEIIFDDFLNRNIREDLKKYNYKNLYIIANLPYYITTPIIDKIINENIEVEMMKFMVQKEVGERFTAKVGTKNYNSLTVYLNYIFTIEKNFIVSRNSFVPKPNVDSMIVSFYKKEKRKVINEKHFFKLVKDSFKFKRKTLKNNLKDYNLKKLTEILKELGYDENIRAEKLSVEDFCIISDKLQ